MISWSTRSATYCEVPALEGVITSPDEHRRDASCSASVVNPCNRYMDAALCRMKLKTFPLLTSVECLFDFCAVNQVVPRIFTLTSFCLVLCRDAWSLTTIRRLLCWIYTILYWEDTDLQTPQTPCVSTSGYM